ncbi:MAG: hypothetical protein HOW73_51320 [Polyangiaceae bacterium]|nr:hypothetical protein [Polyangiaceae bacterium]
MLPQTPPMAEGDLAQTPYAHLAVYLLDRRLTGELFLTAAEDVVHAIRFERGVPVKIRMGDSYARIGELLVEDGLVSAETVEGAALTGGLLGDVLVLAGYVESAALNAVLDRQFRLRMQHVFELPPETPYQYFDNAETLKDYGGEPACVDPFELLWQGVRAHGELSAFFAPTLDRLGALDLKLHPQALLSRFGFEEDAQLLAEVLALEPTPISGLLDIEGVSPDIVNKFVYALAITRQLDLGRGALPVGLEPASPSAAPARSLAKVQLRSQVHRRGAALDAPGDGERSMRRLSVRGMAVIPREEDAPETVPVSESVSPSEISPATRPSATDVTAESISSDLDFGAAEKEERAPSSVEPAPSSPKVSTPRTPARPDPTLPSASDAPPSIPPPFTAEETPTPAEESSRRLVADTIRLMSVDALMKLAREKIDEKEATMAAEACEVALKKLTDEGQVPSTIHIEVSCLSAWARSLEPHPDLKALAVELDDIIREGDDVAMPRLVRGLLRSRLGNEAGATTDFRRVLEIEPRHELAQRELRGLESRTVKRGETGFLKRLFRR